MPKQQSNRQPVPSNRFLPLDPTAQTSKNDESPSFPREKRTPFPQVGYLFNEVNSLSQLKQDVKDLVLLANFSDVATTSHATLFGRNRHSFLRTRSSYKKQPDEDVSSSKDNSDSKKATTNNKTKPATPPAVIKGKAAIAALIDAKILIKASNLEHTSFETAFPGTTFPHLSMINGLPKCNRSTFNSLLISKLRAAKKVLGLKPTDRLSNEIVTFISRQIDKIFSLTLSKRKQQSEEKKKNTQKPLAPKEKAKKEKKTPQRTIEFVTPSDKQVIDELKKEIQSLKLQLSRLTVPPAPITPTPYEHDIKHITEREVNIMTKFYNEPISSNPEYVDKINKHIIPLGPQIFMATFAPVSPTSIQPAFQVEFLQILNDIGTSKPITAPRFSQMFTINPQFVIDPSRIDNDTITRIQRFNFVAWMDKTNPPYSDGSISDNWFYLAISKLQTAAHLSIKPKARI